MSHISGILILLLSYSFPIYADTIDLTKAPFAAIGDGTTDNREALGDALASLKAGDTLYVPPGNYRVSLNDKSLKIPVGVTLLGQSGKSKFSLESSQGAVKHRDFLKVSSDVTIEGISVERGADFPIVIFPVFGELSNVSLRNCTIAGNKTLYPEKYCHAIQVGVGNVKSLLLHGLEIRDCSFGLFQANNAVGSLESVLVERCLFVNNHASDLEFNSPRGKMNNITVRDCTFRDNLSQTASAGFAVGFANVKTGAVTNCHIRNYGSEALHVEDRSENIHLSGNTIVGGSMKQPNGVIMVVNDSKSVVIDSNYIDARPNGNRPHLILVTAGGKTFANPSGVAVTNNILSNGATTRTWYLQPGSGPEPSGNTVIPFEDSQKQGNL
ncbi:MAG: right-handed parallel beta-helix repeat-containing protein [Verrucomicrobiales bacterium]|nr:right-handed parallel beta-helix repeat-containing protein [Verrucomicrobiales bacterium]